MNSSIATTSLFNLTTEALTSLIESQVYKPTDVIKKLYENQFNSLYLAKLATVTSHSIDPSLLSTILIPSSSASTSTHQNYKLREFTNDLFPYYALINAEKIREAQTQNLNIENTTNFLQFNSFQQQLQAYYGKIIITEKLISNF